MSDTLLYAVWLDPRSLGQGHGGPKVAEMLNFQVLSPLLVCM